MLNFKREVLPLKTESGKLFTLNRDCLVDLVLEVEDFLATQNFMNSRNFSRKVMFSRELKANNTVEGINDSVSLIEKVIKDAMSVKDVERRNRIINLYNGYKYILEGHEINAENVAYLYSILSKDLLCTYDRERMGEKYRVAPVYILCNGRLDGSWSQGVDASNIPIYMKEFFDYVRSEENFKISTDYFIKSQIMHFYFVYIHPYFDINGRTSRTVAMWYLLNNEVYPYIIFNRGINFDSNYDKVIRECRERYEITKFIKYMLINVKKELEKEYLLYYLEKEVNRKWLSVDYQTMEYFLSMNGNMTILDYARFYNEFNDKKRPKEIFEDMIFPLIEDGTLIVDRETKKIMYDDKPNLVLSLNKQRLGRIDTQNVTRLGNIKKN